MAQSDQDNHQLARTTSSDMQDEGVAPQLNLTKLNNLKQITFLGNMMSRSGMFADVARDPAKAIVKIVAGQEMGIPPVEAMRGLDIIQGQVAIGAGLMASRIKASDKYDYKVKEWSNERCLIEFYERSEETGKYELAGPSEFTLEDAKTAGLATKDMWRKYPRNMLFARAISNGQTLYAPDVFQVGTVYTQEEMNDVGSSTPAVVSPPPAALPAPKSDDAPTNDVGDDPSESDVDTDKTVLQLIGEELENKGFENKLDRQKIAFTVAGVESINEASDETWVMVFDTIQGMEHDELAEILQPAAKEPEKPADKTVAQAMADGDQEPPASFGTKDDVADVTDEDLAEVDAKTKAAAEAKPVPPAPKYARGKSLLPRPEMRKDANTFFNELGVTGDKDREEYTQRVINKPKATTFDDYDELIKQLWIDVTGLRESQQEIVSE